MQVYVGLWREEFFNKIYDLEIFDLSTLKSFNNSISAGINSETTHDPITDEKIPIHHPSPPETPRTRRQNRHIFVWPGSTEPSSSTVVFLFAFEDLERDRNRECAAEMKVSPSTRASWPEQSISQTFAWTKRESGGHFINSFVSRTRLMKYSCIITGEVLVIMTIDPHPYRSTFHHRRSIISPLFTCSNRPLIITSELAR